MGKMLLISQWSEVWNEMITAVFESGFISGEQNIKSRDDVLPKEKHVPWRSSSIISVVLAVVVVTVAAAVLITLVACTYCLFVS